MLSTSTQEFHQDYIADQKKEIQEEMDQAYQKTLEIPGVECQFF